MHIPTSEVKEDLEQLNLFVGKVLRYWLLTSRLLSCCVLRRCSLHDLLELVVVDLDGAVLDGSLPLVAREEDERHWPSSVATICDPRSMSELEELELSVREQPTDSAASCHQLWLVNVSRHYITDVTSSVPAIPIATPTTIPTLALMITIATSSWLCSSKHCFQLLSSLLTCSS